MSGYNRKNSRTSRLKLAAQERREYVFHLRKSGMTYAKIAENVVWEYGKDVLPKGYDSRYAWMDVSNELKKIQEHLAESVEAVRSMELERLNTMQNAIWDDALSGNLGAVEKVLRIMKRRADIMGIDATSKHLVQNVDLTKLSMEQIERLAAGESVFDVLFDGTQSNENAAHVK